MDTANNSQIIITLQLFANTVLSDAKAAICLTTFKSHGNGQIEKTREQVQVQILFGCLVSRSVVGGFRHAELLGHAVQMACNTLPLGMTMQEGTRDSENEFQQQAACAMHGVNGDRPGQVAAFVDVGHFSVTIQLNKYTELGGVQTGSARLCNSGQS